MRKDMKKVLTERPRHGSSCRYHEVRQKESRGDYEDLPSYMSMRRPYQCRWGDNMKEFSDHIKPLLRFLWSCIGRSWDDVWSEICASVPSNNTVDSHLRGHVLSEIDIHTFLIDEEVYVRARYGMEPQKPLGLYVDPRDGLIHAGANDRHNAFSYRSEQVVTHNRKTYTKGDDGVLYPSRWYNAGQHPIKVINEREAQQINGIWYWIDYDRVPSARMVEVTTEDGIVLKRVPCYRIDALTGSAVYSDSIYCCKKQQVCSRDLKRNGLRNSI